MTKPASTEQLYDRHASTWNRQEPVLLSDYTARPRVVERLGSVAGLHVWDLGCGEGFMERQLLLQRLLLRTGGPRLSSRVVGFRPRKERTSGRCTYVKIKSLGSTKIK